MANNNDFIQVVARLNETKSKNIIQGQLDKIQKQLQLQLSNVRITKTGQNMLQSSIESIQKNLKVNIGSVNIDQNKIVQQSQQVAQQISSSMSSALNNVDTSGLTRITEQIANMRDSLNNNKNPLSFASLGELQDFVKDALPQFEKVKVSINSWHQKAKEATGQVKSFTAEVLNSDGAAEKLSFHLKNIGKKNATWALTNSTTTDNAIKVQEQALKAAERQAKQLEASVQSGYKTLTHYVQMMNNLSQRQVFNKNASAENVVGWQGDISVQNEKFKELKATIDSGVVSPEVLSKIKELSGAVNDVILKGHEMARTLGQSTSNVNAEAELNNLKTLMNNLKASDVEVEKLKADYGELIGLFVQAEDTGDFSQFFNRLTVFKSKFTEAKSEVRATNAEIADLASMAKQLQSNKLTNFFSRNAGDVRVTGLKTEIAGLITEWDVLNNEIAQTGQITPSTQTKIDSLRTRMEQTTVAADQLQKSIKEDAQAIRLMTQKQSLSTRIQTWLQNNTRASEETRAKLMALQAQIQSADAQQMTNLNNQLRQITSSATAAGEAGMKLGDLVKQKLAKFAGWFSIATVVMRTVRYIKEMATTVRELDTAMTSLRKVTKETEREYNDFFVVATKNAKELGASIKDIIDSTAEFARLGYGLKDASILSEVATLYKNVGDGIDIGEATTSIISTMKAFDLQSSEVESQIVDKFNKVKSCPFYALVKRDRRQILSNCWEFLKLFCLQTNVFCRKRKLETSKQIAYGEIKALYICECVKCPKCGLMDNQQPSYVKHRRHTDYKEVAA